MFFTAVMARAGAAEMPAWNEKDWAIPVIGEKIACLDIRTETKQGMDGKEGEWMVEGGYSSSC